MLLPASDRIAAQTFPLPSGSIVASATGPAGGSLSGSFPNPTIAAGGVDFSTITTQLNTKLSSGAVPTAFVDLSTVVTALAGKLSTTGQAVSVAAGGVDFSTITTQLNTKLSSGAVPTAFVDLSTVVTALAGKQGSGATVTTSSLTVTGSSMSVGTSQFYVYATSAGVMTATPKASLDVNGAINSTSTMIAGTIAFSSVPVFSDCMSISTAGLVNGATVAAFAVDSPITLIRVTTLVQVAGVGGAGDTIACDASGSARIAATSSAASAAGTITKGVGSIAVAIGTNVQCYITSTAAPRPALTLCIGYRMQ